MTGVRTAVDSNLPASPCPSLSCQSGQSSAMGGYTLLENQRLGLSFIGVEVKAERKREPLLRERDISE